jgi:pimeloyl-ACP methyl ester carboxylesterase
MHCATGSLHHHRTVFVSRVIHSRSISIRDMVESQYSMVRKEFGITQLHGIIGGSMGGMQMFEWIVSYPEFMRKAVATVGSPRMTIYNKQGLTMSQDDHRATEGNIPSPILTAPHSTP